VGDQAWAQREGMVAFAGYPLLVEGGRVIGVVAMFARHPFSAGDLHAIASVANSLALSIVGKQAEAAVWQLNAELEARVVQRTAEVQAALATLDATADGAYMFDPASLRFTHVNKGALRQLGYPREELLALSPLDLNTNHDEAAFREMIAPLIRGEKSVLTIESVYHRKDGGKFPVEINLQYVTPDGSPPRFIAIVRDITERKKNEQEFRRAQRLESIGTLAGGVAHDLNNALAPIMMSVGLLREQYPKENEVLDLIQNGCKRSADMVRQLLNFARGTEGERVTLQPGRIVHELEKLMKGSFPKNLEIIVNCDPKLPLVKGDATQLHQVLLNLCVNARDAMPNGGTLTVQAQSILMDEAYASSIPEAKPGRYLLLRVRDTGTGMPPEVLERIFEPFFTTKDPDKGTGLGLSNVMGIMKGHGGFLQVYSQPGHGSTFNVYLPAADPAGDTEPLSKAPMKFRGQGETILVVDDEPGMREMARVLLQRMNFKVVTANDGEDGLMKVAEFHAELRLIITDLHMPHLDGLAFTRALRRKLPDIPVAVTSGRVDDISVKEFNNLGRVSFLDKPFTESELVAMLKTYLQK
jgi:PAS domain S-box-containing protein